MTELEAINYFDLLNGARIRADLNLAESSFIVNRALAIIGKYEQLTEAAQYSARDQIQTLNVSASSKRAIENGFNETLPAGLELARNIWVLEREIVSVMNELVVFVNSASTSWEWEDEQFLFSSDKNLEIFNSYIETVQDLTNRQNSIRESSTQSSNDRFREYLN